MEIGYSKWTLNSNLIMGILWSVVGAFRFYEWLMTGETVWYHVLFIFIGPLYLGLYFYLKGRKFLNISDTNVTITNYFPKTIYFTDLADVRYVVGEYRFTDRNGKKIAVSKEILDKNKVEEFDGIFHSWIERFEAEQEVKQNSFAVS